MGHLAARLAFVPLMILACRGSAVVAPTTGGAQGAMASGMQGASDASAVPLGTDATIPDASTAAGDGAGTDGGQCIYIDLSTFDRSCKADSDCIAVTPGLICNHLCGGDAINIDGQARYWSALAPILDRPGWGSSCPSLGKPRCLPGSSGGTCTWCPSRPSADPIPLGCPNAP